MHAVGGVEEHIHLAVSVPPRIALSEFIRQVKGSSSHFVNHELEIPITFAWQGDYGVVTFGGRQLARVIQYVKEQPQRHIQGVTIPALERLAGETRIDGTGPGS